MNRRATCTLALLLLAATPAKAAPGVTLSGFVSTGYLLSTDRLGSQSLFDLAGALSVGGGLLDPGLLRWGLGATYWGHWGLGHQGSNSANRLGFDAHLTALSRTPLTLSLAASRAYSDTTSGTSAAQLSGNSATTSLGATANFRVPGSPMLTARVGRTVVETEHLTGGSTSSGSTRFGAGISQGLSGFDYSVAYDTGWNDGTYSELNYHSDTVTARMSGALDKRVRFNVSDSYYLRLPTNQLQGNPRFDSNVMATGLQWLASPRLTAGLAYSNQQALIADPGKETLDTRNQQLQETLSYQVLEGLQIRQSLAGQYAHAALGGTQKAGWGQSLGLGLLWQRPVSGFAVAAGVDGSAGLVEPDEGGLNVSYGAGANASISGNLSRAAGTLAYNVGFSAGGPAVSGYTFQQAVRVEASVRPNNNSVLSGFLNAVSGRREDAFLGTFINRALTARLRFAQQQHLVELTGGLTDGVSDALTNPGFGGGLFLPSSYNTQSSYLHLTASSNFDSRRLGVRVSGTIGSTASPYRAPEVGAGLAGSISYNIGKFRVTLEDRLLSGGLGTGSSVNNTFMVRLSRDFSGEFFNQ